MKMARKNSPDDKRHLAAEFAPLNHDASMMDANSFSAKHRKTLRRQKNGNLFVEVDLTRYVWSKDGSEYKGWVSGLLGG